MTQDRAQKILKQAIEQALDYIIQNSDNPQNGYRHILNLEPESVGFGSTATRNGLAITAGLTSNKNIERVRKGFKAIR